MSTVKKTYSYYLFINKITKSWKYSLVKTNPLYHHTHSPFTFMSNSVTVLNLTPNFFPLLSHDYGIKNPSVVLVSNTFKFPHQLSTIILNLLYLTILLCSNLYPISVYTKLNSLLTILFQLKTKMKKTPIPPNPSLLFFP